MTHVKLLQGGGVGGGGGGWVGGGGGGGGVVGGGGVGGGGWWGGGGGWCAKKTEPRNRHQEGGRGLIRSGLGETGLIRTVRDVFLSSLLQRPGFGRLSWVTLKKEDES